MQKIIIFDFNRTLYDPERRVLLDDALMVLQTLQQRGFALYLLSHAVPWRVRLLDEFGLRQYFTKILMSEQKTLGQVQEIIEHAKADLSQSFMVGDRIKSEISLGKLVGLKTIWVRRGKFSDEVPENNDEQPQYIVQSLKALLTIIL